VEGVKSLPQRINRIFFLKTLKCSAGEFNNATTAKNGLAGVGGVKIPLKKDHKCFLDGVEAPHNQLVSEIITFQKLNI